MVFLIHTLRPVQCHKPGDRNLGCVVRTSDITRDIHVCFLHHFSLQVTIHSNCQKHQGRKGRVQAVRDQQAQPTAPAREPAWIGATTSDTPLQNEQIIERADGIGMSARRVCRFSAGLRVISSPRVSFTSSGFSSQY